MEKRRIFEIPVIMCLHAHTKSFKSSYSFSSYLKRVAEVLPCKTLSNITLSTITNYDKPEHLPTQFSVKYVLYVASMARDQLEFSISVSDFAFSFAFYERVLLKRGDEEGKRFLAVMKLSLL